MLILINQWKQAARQGEGVINFFPTGLRAAEILVPMQVALAQVNIPALTPYIKRAHWRENFFSWKSAPFPFPLFHQFPSPQPVHTFTPSCSNLAGLVVMEDFMEERGGEFQLYTCSRNGFQPHLGRKGLITPTEEKIGSKTHSSCYPCVSGTWCSAGVE